MVGCSMSRSSRGLNTSHDWLGDSRKVGAGAITQDPSEHMDSMSLTEFTRLLHSDEDFRPWQVIRSQSPASSEAECSISVSPAPPLSSAGSGSEEPQMRLEMRDESILLRSRTRASL